MNAPSVTIEQVEAAIVSETYTLLPNGRTTVCQLTLFDNGDTGFTVEGQSICVSKANYDEAKGKKYARQRAIDKVWEVLGYGLAKELHAQHILKQQTFKDRLHQEHAELDGKVNRLRDWINSSNFNAMSADEKADQEQQYQVMKQYLQILERRITRLGLQN